MFKAVERELKEMKNSIKVQRAMHDMTQQELADRVGVSRQTINAVELGKLRSAQLHCLFSCFHQFR